MRKLLTVLFTIGMLYSVQAQTFDDSIYHEKKVFSNQDATVDKMHKVATFVFYGKALDHIGYEFNNTFKQFYHGDFSISFEHGLERKEDAVGVSYAGNNDCKVDIKIDADAWRNYSTLQKMWLVFHELGHDVLNLKHTKTGLMMPNIPKDTKITTQKLFRALTGALEIARKEESYNKYPCN